jgi:hypothetical protein
MWWRGSRDNSGNGLVGIGLRPCLFFLYSFRLRLVWDFGIFCDFLVEVS